MSAPTDDEAPLHNSRLGNLGMRIRAARRMRDITQKTLAQRVGMTRARLALLERRGRNIAMTTLYRIADELNVDPGDLVTERDD